MSALIEVSISANYNNEQALLDRLNQHLGIDYNKDSNEICFNIDYGEDDHYATFSVDKDELLDAIKRAMEKPLE